MRDAAWGRMRRVSENGMKRQASVASARRYPDAESGRRGARERREPIIVARVHGRAGRSPVRRSAVAQHGQMRVRRRDPPLARRAVQTVGRVRRRSISAAAAAAAARRGGGLRLN
jgi:hypothetical protein